LVGAPSDWAALICSQGEPAYDARGSGGSRPRRNHPGFSDNMLYMDGSAGAKPSNSPRHPFPNWLVRNNQARADARANPHP